MAGYTTPAWANNSSPAIDAAALTAMGQAIELGEHPYGVCSTGSSTAAKTVTIDYSGTLTLFAGLSIRVKFTYQNSANNPTLNVNGTGAIPIMYRGTVSAKYDWGAGEVVSLMYDGTNWLVENGSSDILRIANAPVTVSTTKGEILRIENPAITSQHVPVLIIISNRTAVKNHLEWSTVEGAFTVNSVCLDSTSATVILVKNTI